MDSTSLALCDMGQACFNEVYTRMRTKEKIRLRQRDRRFFYSLLGHRYMEGLQIHHDWENGCFCYLLTHREHMKVHFPWIDESLYPERAN